MLQYLSIFLASVLILPAACIPVPQASSASSAPLVFAHYMLITRPPNGDYTNDINLARNAGVDAFAINYGGWNVDWTVQAGYLNDFYSAASSMNFKVFLSIDTTSVTDPNMVVQLVNQYAVSPAQLTIDGKTMLSTFTTNPPAWNWQTDVLDKINSPVFFIPGSLSTDATSLFAQAPGDGFFPWIHPTATVSDEASYDQAYAAQRSATGKKWMAAIAPWFFKRFDANDNWSHAQDDSIFIDRMLNLLKLQPDFLELVTWNDWGESSYFGPADTTGSVPTAYWDTLDHGAFLKMVTVFIKAYKAGQTGYLTIDAADEDVYFFYRLQPATTLGSSDSLPLPLDAEYLKDDVYIVSFLPNPADITLNSGGNVHQFSVGAGVWKTAIPWTWGTQSITASRNGAQFVSKTGPSVEGQLSQYDGNVVAL